MLSKRRILCYKKTLGRLVYEMVVRASRENLYGNAVKMAVKQKGKKDDERVPDEAERWVHEKRRKTGR